MVSTFQTEREGERNAVSLSLNFYQKLLNPPKKNIICASHHHSTADTKTTAQKPCKQGMANVGLQLGVCEAQFIVLFIHFCIIFHMNNYQPTFAQPCIHCVFVTARDW